MKRRILLVEDSTAQGTHAVETLQRLDFDVAWATSGLDGLKMARELVPDLVLLDVVMPDLDGMAVCRWLKLHKRTSNIPVIMLTMRAEIDDRVNGLRLGADDYLPKPFDVKELAARIEAALRAKSARAELQTRNAQLETMLEHMAMLATIDPLTGLSNRRRFADALARESAVTRRYDRPLSCVMLDLDHFKAINDRHGHEGGDAVLTAMASILRASLRDVDVAARYGGEEFAVLLPHTSKPEARIVAERIAQSLRAHAFVIGGRTLEVTASFGIADALDVERGDGEALVRAADLALFDAKRRGRDRVVMFDASLIPAASDVA